MKIRRVEYLAAIAIVTSATVLQIREHTQPHDIPSASAQTTTSTCGAARDGLLPAACERTGDEHQVERAPQPQQTAPQIWV